jgi:hypothetical protein
VRHGLCSSWWWNSDELGDEAMVLFGDCDGEV